MNNWNLLSNHGLVLVVIAENPARTAKDISNYVDLTERTTHKIIVDLVEEGYITRNRVGRNNTYKVHPNKEIKDRVTNASIGELLAPLTQPIRGVKKKEANKYMY